MNSHLLYRLLQSLKPGENSELIRLSHSLNIQTDQIQELIALSHEHGRDDLSLSSNSIVNRSANSPILLNPATITKPLQHHNLNVIVQPNCSTTMNLSQTCNHYPSLYLTEQQSMGIGQHKKIWHSPLCGNIYATYVLKIDHSNLFSIAFFSVATALAIRRTLIAKLPNKPITIKWPNDIMIHDKKVAGLIIQSESNRRNIILRIGIGINVNLQADPMHNITQPWTSLSRESNQYFDPNEIAIHLSQAILILCSQMQSQTNRLKFINEYNQFSYQINQLVTTTDKQTQGYFRGINNNAMAIVECNDSQRLIYNPSIY